MAGARHTTPLFDLLRSARPAPGVSAPGVTAPPPTATPREHAPYPPKPVVRVELKPAPRGGDEPPARGAWYSTLLGGQPIPVSLNLLFLSGFLAVVALLGTWVAAYHWGKSDAEKDLEPFRRSLTPSESLNNQPEAPGTGDGGNLARREESKPVAPAGDPREVGLNYLRMGDVPQAEAEGLVQFLAEKGVRSFAVKRLDTPRGMANNQGPFYTVFALPGYVVSEETRPTMDAMKSRVQGLAGEWRRQRRGGVDLSTAFYEKFK